MSVKASSIVWAESKQKGAALLMLLALADYAHDDGSYAFPSVQTLTKKTRMTRRNVQLLLRKLEDAGEIMPMGIHNSGTVIYRLLLPGFGERGVKFTRGDQGDAGGRKDYAGGAIIASPDPSLNDQQPSESDATFVRRFARSRGWTLAEASALASTHTKGGTLNRAAFLAGLGRR